MVTIVHTSRFLVFFDFLFEIFKGSGSLQLYTRLDIICFQGLVHCNLIFLDQTLVSKLKLTVAQQLTILSCILR